jgi:hypothetical protein
MKPTLLTEEQIKIRVLSWEADAPTRGAIERQTTLIDSWPFEFSLVPSLSVKATGPERLFSAPYFVADMACHAGHKVGAPNVTYRAADEYKRTG